MSQLAMLVIVKNSKGVVKNVLTVKVGERIEFGRYTNSDPHVCIPSVNGSSNSITAYGFDGEVEICNANGEVIQTVTADSVEGAS